MVDSRDKGSRAETAIKTALKSLTGLDWQRTPGSGALDPKHLLKGDLYIPGRTNLFCVECKHYADDHFTSKILTDKNPQIYQWWEQCKRQGVQVNRKPLLIFKHDRSKMFVAYEELPNSNVSFVFVNREPYEFYISLLEDWVLKEAPQFVS